MAFKNRYPLPVLTVVNEYAAMVKEGQARTKGQAVAKDANGGRIAAGKATAVRVGDRTVSIIEHRDVGRTRRSRLKAQSEYVNM